jgi:hypothetical protein
MSIRTWLFTTAAAATAVAALLPLSSAPAAPDTTFTVQSKLDRPTLHRFDNGKHGDSAGDVFVLATKLSRDGKAAGRGEYVQTAVDDRYRGISMTVHLLLPDGTLDLQGAGLDRRAPGLAKPSAEADLAVVGGTGAYAGASGTVHPIDVGSHQDLEVHLGS